MQSAGIDTIGQGEIGEDSVVGDVTAVFSVLQRLLRDKSLDPGLDGLQISIGDDGTGVAYGKCTVEINADSAANRDALVAGVKKMGDGNWKCTNVGDKGAKCENPPPQN